MRRHVESHQEAMLVKGSFHLLCVCCSVFMELVGEKSRHLLQDNLHLITSPVQVVWGTEDQVQENHSHAGVTFTRCSF